MRQQSTHIKIPEQARAATGVDGLDDILGGGLPTNYLYLVEGTPGSGKTTLGLQFLRRGVEQGQRGLYITLAETSAELTTVAASHGWSLEGVEVFELVNDEGLSPESEQSILHSSEVELGETTRGVMAAVERLKPARVVFDSLSEMRMLAQNSLRYRRQVLALKSFFSASGCTVLMLDDRTSEKDDLQLHSIAHGVISLEQMVNQYGPERRRVRVVKMRGIRFRGGEHDFQLGHWRHLRLPPAGGGRASSDSARQPGQYWHAGAGQPAGRRAGARQQHAFQRAFRRRQDHHCDRLRPGRTATRRVLFDEGLGTLLVRSRALGLDIAPFIKSGDLDIKTLDPAEVSPGQFADMVRIAVENHQTQTVVIDSLNAYLQAMSGDNYLLLQMHELLTYLNQRGVVAILILAQHGVLGEVRSDIDLSYLSDGILMFWFFEARGSLLKAVPLLSDTDLAGRA